MEKSSVARCYGKRPLSGVRRFRSLIPSLPPSSNPIFSPTVFDDEERNFDHVGTKLSISSPPTSSSLSELPESPLNLPDSPQTLIRSVSPSSLFEHGDNEEWEVALVSSAPSSWHKFDYAAKPTSSQSGVDLSALTPSEPVSVHSQCDRVGSRIHPAPHSPTLERVRRGVRAPHQASMILKEQSNLLNELPPYDDASKGGHQGAGPSCPRPNFSQDQEHLSSTSSSQPVGKTLRTTRTLSQRLHGKCETRSATPPTSPNSLQRIMSMSQSRPEPPKDCPGRSTRHQLESQTSSRPAGSVQLDEDGLVKAFLPAVKRKRRRPERPMNLIPESINVRKNMDVREISKSSHDEEVHGIAGQTAQETEDDVVFELLRGYSRRKRRNQQPIATELLTESDEELDFFFRGSAALERQPQKSADHCPIRSATALSVLSQRNSAGDDDNKDLRRQRRGSSLQYRLAPARVPENMKSYFRRKDREEAQEGGSPTGRKSREAEWRQRHWIIADANASSDRGVNGGAQSRRRRDRLGWG